MTLQFPRKVRLGAVLTVGMLGGLVVACTAHKQPSKVETALANMAKDVVIPIEAENLKNPQSAIPEVIRQGREIYVQSCAICHGADAHAATELGRAMYPPAMDLTSPHVQHWTDAELFWIIQNGVRLTGMPSWKSIRTTQQTWHVVNFIKALPTIEPGLEAEKVSNPPQTTQAQMIAY